MKTKAKKIKMNESSQMAFAVQCLLKPYSRLVTPEPDGSFFAEIREFEGCIATGQTSKKALQALEDVAQSWVLGMLASGQEIPEPIRKSEYSGRFVVRMPKSLHEHAARTAEVEGVSLNQFVVTCVAKSVGSNQANVKIASSLEEDFGKLFGTARASFADMHIYMLPEFGRHPHPIALGMNSKDLPLVGYQMKSSGYQPLMGVMVSEGVAMSSNSKPSHPYFGKRSNAPA